MRFPKRRSDGKLRYAIAHDQLYDTIRREPWSSELAQEKLIVRIHAFLYCSESWPPREFQLFLDSAEDILEVLTSILNSEITSTLACKVTMRMVRMLPCSSIKSAFVLIHPLAHLLRNNNHKASISFAETLNNIIRKSSSRHDQKLLQIVEKSKAVRFLVRNIRDFRFDARESKFLRCMADLLQNIIVRWPRFRFIVWHDYKFLKILDDAKLKSNIHFKDAAVGLYSGLALCHNWVDKLLTSGDELLPVILDCMGPRKPAHLRIEAFIFARRVAASRTGCMKMLNICCDPLVKSVITAIKIWNERSEIKDNAEAPAGKEACYLASITRWAGDHHQYFWKEGLDRVLLSLILDDYGTIHRSHLHSTFSTLQSSVAWKFQKTSKRFLRPYVWDILGGLAANCEENFKRETVEEEFQLKVLILCLCLAFIKGNGESAARAMALVANSKSKYVSSLARSILPEVLAEKFSLEKSLDTLKSRVYGKIIGVPKDLDIVVSLLNLACHSCLPLYQERIIQHKGVETLIAFVLWWLKNPVRIKRENMSPHLQFYSGERYCCLHGTEEWEGEDTLLLFSLWILAEMLPNSTLVNSYEDPIVYELQEVCVDSKFCSGSRWYAAYILRCIGFGSYDFTSRMGRRKCRKLEYLLKLANKGVPKWGTPMPKFDLAILPAEYNSPKILVEANGTESVNWKCDSCSKSIPHLHVPKAVLKLSSDYFDNLFRSRMKDSCRKTSKAPVSWESLEKLGPWLYLEPLPVPNFGCLWANMDPAEKLREVGLYLQLCGLADYWGTDDLYEECYRIVVSCLDFSTNMPAEIIQIAYDLNLKNLVQLAAEYLAPKYHQLKHSGEFDTVNKNLIKKVRTASEQLISEARSDKSSSSSPSEHLRSKGSIRKPR